MDLDESTSLRRIAMPPADASVPPTVFRFLQRTAKAKPVSTIARELQIHVEEVLPIAFALVITGWAEANYADQPADFDVDVISKDEIRKESLAAERLRQRIEDDYKKLRTLNFYEIFKIGPGFTDKDLEKAFLSASSKYSTNKLQSVVDADLRDKAAQIHSWIKLAYETLRNPKLRHVYARHGSRKSSKQGREKHIEGERLLLKGIQALEEQNYIEAAAKLDEAFKVCPGDPTIPGYLGWALFQADRDVNMGVGHETSARSHPKRSFGCSAQLFFR